MSVGVAMRLVMLKNAVTAQMSQMSRSLNPARRSALRSAAPVSAGTVVSRCAKSSIARCLRLRTATR